MDNKEARREYEQLGFDTIPLRAGTKIPINRDWPNSSPYRMWKIAPDDANIGIRTGDGLAVLDCDDKNSPGTYENVASWLIGLGYENFPLVQTASKVGRHIYVNYSGDFGVGHSRKFKSDFGSGELRFGNGAQVAAPPSVITNEGDYRLIDGDLRHLPLIDLDDIQAIVSSQPVSVPASTGVPKRAAALLAGKCTGFTSRSEAEQSLIQSLVNAGHDFNSVKNLFIRWPCAGKFAELRAQSERNAERWLTLSFDKAAQRKDQDSNTRKAILQIRDWALSRAWPGRTGAVDRAVLLAHSDIAYKAGKLIYSASSRSLAELAGVGFMTASRSTHRLREDGLLELAKKAVADCANVYQLKNCAKWYTSSHVVDEDVYQFAHHDAFRYGGGLGKSAAEIFAALQSGPLTVKELADITGRHRTTIKRALERMTGITDIVTGEIINMVELDDGKWNALKVDLDHIAQVIGTSGIGKRQKRRHRADRKAHRHQLSMFELRRDDE